MRFLRRNILFIFIVLLVLAGCKRKSEIKKAIDKTENILPVVFIQPLGNVNDSLVGMLKNGLENALPIQTKLMPAVRLPSYAWYAPKHRYWADSILVLLKPLYNQKNSYTLGITEEDISTKRDLQQNWGVMGLGFQPGNCCVVSTYRLYKYPQTQKQLLDKLLKVSLHELGHNAGLPHCIDIHCLMTDAKGKNILANENGFCTECAKTLAKKGLQPKKSTFF